MPRFVRISISVAVHDMLRVRAPLASGICSSHGCGLVAQAANKNRLSDSQVLALTASPRHIDIATWRQILMHLVCRAVCKSSTYVPNRLRVNQGVHAHCSEK